jgi:hypothetical protein
MTLCWVSQPIPINNLIPFIGIMQSKGSEYDMQEGQMGYHDVTEFHEKSKEIVEDHELPFKIYRPINTVWRGSETQPNRDEPGKDTTYIECSAYTKGSIFNNKSI